jgi:hypothetical protein
VVLTMANSPRTWKTKALDGLLTVLADQLESAIDVVASINAPQRMDEILTLCINASALAKASQTVMAKPD